MYWIILNIFALWDPRSKLPYKPDEKKIKELLLNCLEHHYGNLSNCIVLQDRYVEGLKDIRGILDKLGVY